MILLPRPLLKNIVDAAEAAYPLECCGLLVGYAEPPQDLIVTRVEVSPNIAEENAGERFEVSPKLRLDLMRALEGGPERIIGHFHSHPDHPAQPSPRDLERAWEPDLIWLITSVLDGQAIHTTAHVLDADGLQFREVSLHTDDWLPYAIREHREETNGETT
ncbi:MAG: M67 family metallopeptidase [Rhodospirillales bacterium]|nr:M67 family metallopeptidase [Rhodospirillales bacterium]